ncbi:MAG: hypothetical protein COA57_11945 [Flavobacteriales bacterium]|nr:MAG: hypothetical protein COA57_11945 [Flavobacteriales bacterium]
MNIFVRSSGFVFMIRQSLIKKGVGSKDGFHFRGSEPSRMDAFTDAVFAFAITLLVVSLEVPQSTSELFETIQGFVPFGICIVLLMQVWFSHYHFSLRYGLTDNYTMYLNVFLLFVVLFYVYPLKFLFTFLFKLLLYLLAAIFSSPSALALKTELFDQMIRNPEHMNGLMLIYGAGAAAMFLVFYFLYRHAFRKKEELKLSTIELFETRTSMNRHLLMAIVPLFSIIITLLLSIKLSWQAGAIGGVAYCLYGIAIPVYETIMGKRRKKLFPE